MGIINSIFREKPSHNQLPEFWKKIESEEDLRKAIATSYDKKVVIFKHSTRCFISKTVLKNFENEVENHQDIAHFYYLDLLVHRNLSNQIAQDFGVVHQSPQIIVLKNGELISNASHQEISLKSV